MAADVEYRIPDGFRTFGLVFAMVWVTGVIAASAAAMSRGYSLALPGGFAFLAIGGLLYWRMDGLSVVAAADQLVLANFLRTHRLERSSIRGFEVGNGGLTTQFEQTVLVITDNGKVIPVEAFVYPGWPWKRDRGFDTELLRLRAWLHSS